MILKRPHRVVGTYPVVRQTHTGKDESKAKSLSDHIQTLIAVVISISTAFIAWQTYQLSERTEVNNEHLKGIEQELSKDRFGFERVRDIYTTERRSIFHRKTKRSPEDASWLCLLVAYQTRQQERNCLLS